MSNRGWLIAVVLSILLIYGGIFVLRMSFPPYGESNGVCYDIDSEGGIPEFIDVHFIELDRIEYIKRFRSGFGTDYSDDFEKCRDMTHSYIPFKEYWGMEKVIKIYSPVNGTIIQSWPIPVSMFGTEDWEPGTTASRIVIQCLDYPAFNIELAPVDIRDVDINSGMEVSAGQLIGYGCMTHANRVTQVPYIGISVNVELCSKETQKLSYFDVLTDNIFEDYKDRGATSREEFIISKEDREADSLNCTYDPNILGSWIYEEGNIPNWIYLGTDPSDFSIVSENPKWY
jgi:hypothetical protein